MTPTEASAILAVNHTHRAFRPEERNQMRKGSMDFYLRNDLRRGDLVEATLDFDLAVADVKKGAIGVVFEEAGFHEEKTGPMVRWFNGCACNVYGDDIKPVIQGRDFSGAIRQLRAAIELYSPCGDCESEGCLALDKALKDTEDFI